MWTPRRLRAPQQDRECLAQPPWQQWEALCQANQQLLTAAEARLAGRPLSEWRAQARAELLPAARKYLLAGGETVSLASGPIVLAGHQPEFSHAGVWIKNFALHGLARRLAAVPLNLIVDNDLAPTPTLRFPTWPNGPRPSDPREVRLATLPLELVTNDVPYEEAQFAPDSAFHRLPQRLGPLLASWPFEPILVESWASASAWKLDWPDLTSNVTRLRRFWERQWNCHNLELPVSRLAETPVFRQFLAAIAADHARFHTIYNRAVETYRRLHRLRSRNHPVPLLRREGELWELPFWCWSAQTQFRRQPLWYDGTRQCFRGEENPTKIRPRALTLTLFARLCLGDCFIHGIGGGKYDEVTDAIIRDWLGIEPPRYIILSGTLHLPIAGFRTTAEQLVRQERLVRDLYWTPERYLHDQPPPEELTRKLAWIAEHPPDRAGRRARYRQLVELTQRLRQRVDHLRVDAEAVLQRMRAEVSANALLKRRDYPWLFHPKTQLAEFLAPWADAAPPL